MVIVFQNLFGVDYEGGANWLEISLLSLGMLPQPPSCLVLGATSEILPQSVRDAAHVRAVPLNGSPQSKGRQILKRITRRALRRPWEDGALTRIAAEHDVDLWVGFSGFEGLGPQRPLLVWYPDFQFRHFPELFSSEEIRNRERQWNFVAARADGIIAISQAVAEDALAMHPQVADKLFVCGFPPIFPLAKLAQDPDAVRRKYHLPERFFLVCNQFWQHKNHALVFKALHYLNQNGATAPVIAFTGLPYDYRRPDAFSNMLRFVNEHGLSEYCRFLGVIPRAEQIALIRAATAVIQPSKFEGRGAIVEEASLLGAPLLCSDLPVHRELHAPGALFFSPDRVEELAELMKQEYAPSGKDVQTIAEESLRLARAYGEEFMTVCERVLNSHRNS
jgi:glycosyltransferase involved in cell wall biosynthesis